MMLRYQTPPTAKLPLTDNERALVAFLRALALHIAKQVRDLDEVSAAELVDREVRDLVESLESISEGFAQETERYLRQAIRMACAH